MNNSNAASEKIPRPSVLSPQLLIFVAALVGAFSASALCATGRYLEAAGAAAATLVLAFIFAARVSVESVLAFWFAATPLASFFVRFPTNKSIITFDRAVFALVAVMIAWNRWRRKKGGNGDNDRIRDTHITISRFEIAWMLLSVIALASATIQAYELNNALRIAIDSFWLPLVAFHIARNHFDVRAGARWLLLGAMAVAFFLLITGAYEIATGVDLLQYKGSELIREGELRVNGPFAADSSYANIGLLVVVFLAGAPQAFNLRLDRAAQVARYCALLAAIVALLLPMFRAVAAALVVALIVYLTAKRSGKKASEGEREKGRKGEREWGSEGVGKKGGRGEREVLALDNLQADSKSKDQPVSPSPSLPHSLSSSRRWFAVILLALAIGLTMFGPFAIDERLKDPFNAYGRFATWEAAIGIILEKPWLGVGLTNYAEYFYQRRLREDIDLESFESARAADSPHSNALWIAADLGLFALAAYLAANIYLFLIGYRAIKKAQSARARAAAACFIALVVAYWIPGLTLASGYYSDLNLYFFFMLGLLSNKSVAFERAAS